MYIYCPSANVVAVKMHKKMKTKEPKVKTLRDDIGDSDSETEFRKEKYCNKLSAPPSKTRAKERRAKIKRQGTATEESKDDCITKSVRKQICNSTNAKDLPKNVDDETNKPVIYFFLC
ncbi:uncharacterized protein LOC135169827 isoform X2 [Diachasmimorpha longicaudata]|uniref:uncharacterized protein LOC135169827 isoform X2 n=1 Tax=Diachasmimorpha longicaudata TaxID=58733 RepID=UPI0030B86B84